jgi:hypothetical protein
MKTTNKKTALIFSISICLALFSCKKDVEVPDLLDETTPTTSVTPSYTYKANDADAVFIAVNAVTYQNIPVIGLQKIDVNTAVAVFYSSTGIKPYVNGGSVSCEGKALTPDTSKTYLFVPSGTETITFNGNTDWVIGGNSSTGMPAANFSSASPVPTYNGIANGSLTSNVNRANDLTITINGTVTNADSAFVTISSGSGYVQKIVAANSNCTFTAAQLAGLNSTNGAANGIVQVAPFKIESTTVSGKKYYFVNEAAYTKFITVD